MSTRTLSGMSSWRSMWRLEPVEAFEVVPWRALALFRLTTLAYALISTAHNAVRFPHPYGAWIVSAVMVAWSGLATVGYERGRLRAWPMLLADLVVSAGCVFATTYVIGQALVDRGVPTLTISWMACPPLAVALVKGVRWGVVAALAMGVCDLVVRGVISQVTLNGTILMVMAAAALDYLGNLGVRTQEQL